MTIGIVILAHEHLHRTRQLARALASARVKVMIHVDADTDDADFEKLASSLVKNSHIEFCERISCEWGRFSLVKAGLSAAEAMLTRWPNLSHVVQISGSCLPVRPVDELVEFLATQPKRDFVESRCVQGEDWVIDGLACERFSLYFPFSWQRQRWLFDMSVGVQRKLGVKRSLPDDLAPHLGSQWWCLCRKTLKAILNDPNRAAYDAYFEKCWIPDEGYIPTLVRKHSRDLVNQSLTLSRFDDQGKPHLFYDDHADLLRQTDHFFARKIWHRADGLYRRFLSKKRMLKERPMETEFGLDLIFRDAFERRCQGRPGRLNVGRFPAAKYQRQPATAMRYGAFVGFSHIYENFQPWLEETTGTVAHGRLYKKNAVQFARGIETGAGGLEPNPRIRDHNPEQYLCNLLWSTRGTHQTMMMELSDGERMCAFLAQDPNAQVFVLSGGWVLELFAREPQSPQIVKRQAKRLMAAERKFEQEIAKSGRLDVHRVTLRDLIDGAETGLAALQEALRPGVDLRPDVPIELRDLSGLARFVRELGQLGVYPETLGPLPAALMQEDEEQLDARATA